MLPEIRMAGLVDALCRHRAKQLSCVDAAEALGMSERHFRRLRDSYAAEGAEGLLDGRRGRAPGNKGSEAEITWVTEEFRARYFDFTARHFHEAVHGKKMPDGKPFQRSYSWTKSVLQYRGLITKAKKRGKHRRKRARRPLPGMMLFQDGSTHAWFQGLPNLDLIVTMDDATSRIFSIFLVEQEGTASSFRGIWETIRAHGLFSSFYTDRGSHYFYTPKAGEKVDKAQLTQVGRALRDLLITHIASYSAQGRGRMERLWSTLQSRLPPLFRQQGISDIETANVWLRDVYMPQHNARFAVEASEEGTAFIPFTGALEEILCIHDERVVSQDNTVRYENRVLQIPQSRHRHHFVQTTVRVHEYWDGSLALFHGPRKIAAYNAQGVLIGESQKGADQKAKSAA